MRLIVYSNVAPYAWFWHKWLKILITKQLFILSALNLSQVTSNDDATKERKSISDNCFYLEVTIF